MAKASSFTSIQENKTIMKKLILLTLCLICFTFLGMAQEPPCTEFLVTLSEEAMTVKPGESRQVTVHLQKSKSYSNAKASFALSSGLPSGVSVVFDPAEGKANASTATVSVGKETPAGTYSIALGATMLGKKKGSLIKLVVTENTALLTSQN
jgi:hypothetical protein